MGYETKVSSLAEFQCNSMSVFQWCHPLDDPPHNYGDIDENLKGDAAVPLPLSCASTNFDENCSVTKIMKFTTTFIYLKIFAAAASPRSPILMQYKNAVVVNFIVFEKLQNLAASTVSTMLKIKIFSK